VIVDDFTRECLALEIAYSLTSAGIIRVLERVAIVRSLPKTIRFDNGTEFTSLLMLKWAATHGVELHFIEPGGPTQNAHIEALNGRIRDELFNAHVFTDVFNARAVAAQWLHDYNEGPTALRARLSHSEGVRGNHRKLKALTVINGVNRPSGHRRSSGQTIPWSRQYATLACVSLAPAAALQSARRT